MWATAVVEIGLAPEHFWSLTPVEFDLLCERHAACERRMDRRAGLVAAAIANYAGMKRDAARHPKPFTVEEMLGWAPSNGYQSTELERMRAALDPIEAGQRYLEHLRAADPQAEITMSKAVIDGLARGRGEWTKLGTREGLTQPLSIIQAMNPGWKP